METVFLDSDIAKMVLGYLRKNNFDEAALKFCETSPLMKKEDEDKQDALEDIFRELCKISTKVDKVTETMPLSIPLSLKKKSLSSKVSFLIHQANKRRKRVGSTDDEGDQEEEDGGGELGGGEEGDAERRAMPSLIKPLMPHCKNKLRNPSVNQQSKFRKALIRRKGAVWTVRSKESKRYGGEVSGIKATIKKGMKIKS